MAELLKFILGVFGLVSVINVFSKNNKYLNRKPFICSLCMGFHVGFFMAWLLGYDHIILWSGVGAGSSWILSKFVTGEN